MRTLLSTLRTTNPDDCELQITSILDAGFAGLVVEDPLHASAWDRLSTTAPKNSVHALRLFVPYARNVRLDERIPLGIAEVDASSRDEAVRLGLMTLEAADRVGAPLVLLPTVDLEYAGLRGGLIEPSRAVGFDESTAELRSPVATKRVSALLSTLSTLLDRADRYSTTLCLTPTNRPGEMPDLDETSTILAEFDGAPIGLWLDTARWPPMFLEVPIIGGADESGGLGSGDEIAARVEGVTIQDAHGTREGLAPGDGDIEWTLLASSLRRHQTWCLDLSSRQSDALSEGLEWLRELGGEAGKNDGTESIGQF